MKIESIIPNYTQLLQQAYKKLKSSIFFDKTQLVLRDKIVRYEASSDFDPDFIRLSKRIISSDWDSIINSIGYLSFPKSIKSNKDSKIISNLDSKSTEVDKLQCFLDMDVEGYILGIVWLLVIGNQIDKKTYEHSYGNRVRKNILNKNGEATYSPYLFEPYFQQYENWRDTALSYAQKSLNKGQDVVILMLDFQRFFYQVNISEEELQEYVQEILCDEDYFGCNEYKFIVKELTDFVWKVIKKYSEILRSDYQELIGNRNVLPIGFHPSNVLSNFALKKFDDAMINGWNPIYYGRYVDDIIIVEKIEKNSFIYKAAQKGELTATMVIEHYLTNCSAWQKNECACEKSTNNGLLIKQDSNIDVFLVNPEYNQFLSSKIIVQQEKVNIFYFNSAQSDALISCFKEQLNKNKSEFRYLPEDEAVFQNDDYTEIFNLTEKDGPNKLRGVKEIDIDKYKLSQYLGKYTRVRGLIHDNVEKQFDIDIEKIFTNHVTVENYLVWEKVLEILIINEKYEAYLNFINRIISAIESVKVIDAESSEGSSDKRDHLIQTLYSILKSSIFRTLSLSWGSKTEQMQEKIEEQSVCTCDQINEMKLNYCRTRMCDKYAMPILIDGFIINKTVLSNDVNLNCTNFESIKNSDYNYNYLSDQSEQYMFYPYLITMNDLTVYNILFKLKCISEDNTNDADSINYLKKLYLSINYHDCSTESSINSIMEVKSLELETKKYNAVKITSKEFKKVKIAVANTLLFESDFDNALQDCPNRSYLRYKQLVKIVNESIRNKADMLVLPEGYLPFEWLPILARTCAKNQMALITGIEHLKLTKGKGKQLTKPTITNLTAVILPYIEDDYMFSYIHFHKKVHMSPHEKEKIESYRCQSNEGDMFELFSWNNFWFSVYCCYELTSIKDRAIFQSYIDALIAVEWNRDTNYYSNIVESLSRDLHCFCIQVNTSEFGDSRITKPSKTENKDILKVKGGKTPVVLFDSVDIDGLRKFQIKGNTLQSKSPDSNNYKQTPPNFNCENTLKKIQGTLWDSLK